MLDSALNLLRRLIPRPLFLLLQPAYHSLLAFFGAILYGFPGRKLTVIGVTGTKGKSSTCEYLNAILEAAGHTTALISTIRIKVASDSRMEERHMTMPGRAVIEQTLARAVSSGCDVAIVEITSEGAVQRRDRFLELDALVFTNLAPEHIEAHGSYEAYAEAKLSIARRLVNSHKRPRFIVANQDDPYGARFLATPVERRLPYSLADAKPFSTGQGGSVFTFAGETIRLHFPGEFSVMNALAAATFARAWGVAPATIARGLESLGRIPGRTENVAPEAPFAVIVDYAHTAESLEALYRAYEGRRICVLGGTGGGRDTWKRPKMGAVAERYCDHVILTDEDPYDEDPRSIVEAVARGMKKRKPEIVMDRRAAIARAIRLARPGDIVLITGKGSNPSICGPQGRHTPWSDAEVAGEELKKLLKGEKV